MDYIARKAEKKFGPGKISKSLVVLYSDLDRIYLSADSEADMDSDADYIIRTWEYSYKEHLKGNRISISWTFHILGDCEEPEGMCSHDYCDGTDEILLEDEKEFDAGNFDRDGFIAGIKDAIITPTNHPERYSEIDADCIGDYEVEVLHPLAIKHFSFVVNCQR